MKIIQISKVLKPQPKMEEEKEKKKPYLKRV